MSDKTINFTLIPNKKSIKENKTIYDDKFERKFNNEIDKVPKGTDRLIAVLFREDKKAKIILVDNRRNDFVHNGHLYFVYAESTYITDNNCRIATYLEGVSTPLSHANIVKETVKLKYKDLDGKLKDKVITRIKGLIYDSRIIQIFTDRKFAEVFTKVGIDKWAFYTFIGLMIVSGLSIAGIIVSYYYH